MSTTTVAPLPPLAPLSSLAPLAPFSSEASPRPVLVGGNLVVPDLRSLLGLDTAA